MCVSSSEKLLPSSPLKELAAQCVLKEILCVSAWSDAFRKHVFPKFCNPQASRAPPGNQPSRAMRAILHSAAFAASVAPHGSSGPTPPSIYVTSLQISKLWGAFSCALASAITLITPAMVSAFFALLALKVLQAIWKQSANPIGQDRETQMV